MENFLEWSSPEHHFDKKQNDWYWILGIITLGAAVLAFWFGNFLFGIFIIIAGATIGMLSFKETKEMSVKISNKGIVLGKQFYPWLSLRSFWIEDEHIHGARILLRLSNSFMPIITISVNEEVDLNDVRDTLLDFLPEEFIQESLLHKWFDHLLARW